MPRSAALLTCLVLGLAGCGGDGENEARDGAPAAGTSEAQACPPQVDKALKDAAFLFNEDDFDGTFATLRPFRDCERVEAKYQEYRPKAAEITLKVAKDRFAEAKKTKDSPQSAVSISKNSLKYFPTPEAKEFLAEAEAALAEFKRINGPKPDEEPGGPPAGAGEGGPPEGKGGEE